MQWLILRSNRLLNAVGILASEMLMLFSPPPHVL